MSKQDYETLKAEMISKHGMRAGTRIANKRRRAQDPRHLRAVARRIDGYRERAQYEQERDSAQAVQA